MRAAIAILGCVLMVTPVQPQDSKQRVEAMLKIAEETGSLPENESLYVTVGAGSGMIYYQLEPDGRLTIVVRNIDVGGLRTIQTSLDARRKLFAALRAEKVFEARFSPPIPPDAPDPAMVRLRIDKDGRMMSVPLGSDTAPVGTAGPFSHAELDLSRSSNWYGTFLDLSKE